MADMAMATDHKHIVFSEFEPTLMADMAIATDHKSIGGLSKDRSSLDQWIINRSSMGEFEWIPIKFDCRNGDGCGCKATWQKVDNFHSQVPFLVKV